MTRNQDNGVFCSGNTKNETDQISKFMIKTETLLFKRFSRLKSTNLECSARRRQNKRNRKDRVCNAMISALIRKILFAQN